MHPNVVPGADFIEKVRSGLIRQPSGCVYYASRSGVCRASPTVLYGRDRISVRKLLAQAAGIENHKVYNSCKNKMCVSPEHTVSQHPGNSAFKDRRTGILYATEDERFLTRVNKTESCWIWTGHIDVYGYGTYRVSLAPKVEKAHRVSFKLFNGPIPAGCLICHKCNVRNCVNPSHLYAGTSADNTADAIAAGTAASVRAKNGEKFYRHNSIKCAQVCHNCNEQYLEVKSHATVKRQFNFCGRLCRSEAQKRGIMPNPLIDKCRQNRALCGRRWD